MFDPILEWLNNVWEAVLRLFQLTVDWLKYGYVWVVGIVWGFLVVTERVVLFVADMVVTLVNLLSSFAAPNGQISANGSTDLLAIANTFFPVEELFTLIAALSLVCLAGIIYRFVKSWIPGLA